MLDIAIIGGGPAGLAAGLKASSEGLNAAIFEASDRLGGRCASSPRIENIPGLPGGISGEEYGRALAAQLEQFGCRTRLHSKAIEIGNVGNPAVLFDVHGEQHWVPARAVLITAGLTERFVPELDGVECKYSCRPDELKRHHGERLLFVGGGNSSAQLGLVAAEHGAEVTIIATRELQYNVSAFLLRQIEEHPRVRIIVGALSGSRTLPEGVTRVRFWTAESMRRSEGGISGLYSEDFEHVYAFAGGVGDVPFFHGEKADDGRILTGADTFEGDELPYQTSVDGVFAAGDVRFGNTGSVAVAAGEGTQAVQTIAKLWLPSQHGRLEPLARN